MNKNILFITGTRAEYGLLKPLIKGFEVTEGYSVVLCVTGTHTLKSYGETIQEIQADAINISDVVAINENGTPISWLGEEVTGIENIFIQKKIDLLVILGDRCEALAGAIVSAHFKVPVAHLHGGDISGHLPDEYIRSAITKFSHLHFAASEKSKERIISMGENPDKIYNVGAIGCDIILDQKLYSKKELISALSLNETKKWGMLLQHPTIDNVSYRDQIQNSISAIRNTNLQWIVIYPNSDHGSQVFINEIENNKSNFIIKKNLNRTTFLSLMNYVDIMIGNSSSGIIESGMFGTPVLNIGNRQLGREHAENVSHSSYNQIEIEKRISQLLLRGKIDTIEDNPYYQGGAVKRIIDVIDDIDDLSSLFIGK